MEAEKIIKFLIENKILDKVNYADMLEAVMLTDGSNIEELLKGIELWVKQIKE